MRNSENGGTGNNKSYTQSQYLFDVVQHQVIKLSLLFFVTAILYAAVGFGGGSTYSALLVLAETDYLLLPGIALVCNIIVVSGGTLKFQRKNLIPWRNAWPLFLFSVPFALLGGRIPVAETVFVLLLGITLLVAGGALLFQKETMKPHVTPQSTSVFLCLVAMGLGLLSGLVGIGGGIFLAPILYFKRWGNPRQIAAVCSVFILVNSLAGLIGQSLKLNELSRAHDLIEYWPLLLAVFIGGQIGSFAASEWLKQRVIRILTALLILFVSLRLLLSYPGITIAAL